VDWCRMRWKSAVLMSLEGVETSAQQVAVRKADIREPCWPPFVEESRYGTGGTRLCSSTFLEALPFVVQKGFETAGTVLKLQLGVQTVLPPARLLASVRQVIPLAVYLSSETVGWAWAFRRDTMCCPPECTGGRDTTTLVSPPQAESGS
jgi:hypothetical protein